MASWTLLAMYAGAMHKSLRVECDFEARKACDLTRLEMFKLHCNPMMIIVHCVKAGPVFLESQPVKVL